jgi:hypothetical protein
MDALLADHEALKGEFQRNLGQTSAAMEDVLSLQESCAKVALLQKEQTELKSTVAGLMKLVQLRENEIISLRSQLQEVRVGCAISPGCSLRLSRIS